jgi:hypothetical protein
MQVIRPFHNLKRRLEFGCGSGGQRPSVAAICPGQLDRGEGPTQVLPQRPGSVAVLHDAAVTRTVSSRAQDVDGEVPLGPVHLLAHVIATAGPADHLRALHRLGSIIAAVDAAFRPAASRMR